MSLATTPANRPNAPTLWARTKAMFATLRDAFTATTNTLRAALAGRDRRRMFARLAPLEKTVRLLLVADAVDYLLMTPQGHRLRHDTPKLAPPESAAPQSTQTTSTRILMPGWQTIAAYRPWIDPRVVEREQREALERQRLRAENPQAAPCRFSVFRRLRDHADITTAPPARQTAGWSTHFPLVPGITRVGDPKAHLHLAHKHTPPRDDLARRIEALARVIANPAPAIRRVAKRLAALPADDLPEIGAHYARSRQWPEGGPEYRDSVSLAAPAVLTLDRCERWRCRPPEAG